MADQLVTPAQVKARLFRAGITDANDDALITELIEQVSDWIQHYTGRQFVPVTSATYVLDTTYGNVVRYPKGIRAITSLGVNAMAHQPPTGGTYTTLAATDYQLRAPLFDTGPFTEIRLGRWTNYVFRNVENGLTFTGTTGFASTPPDIQALAIDAVVAAYSQRRTGVSGIVGADDVALSPWQRFFGRGSLQRAVLDRYAHLAIA